MIIRHVLLEQVSVVDNLGRLYAVYLIRMVFSGAVHTHDTDFGRNYLHSANGMDMDVCTCRLRHYRHHCGNKLVVNRFAGPRETVLEVRVVLYFVFQFKSVALKSSFWVGLQQELPMWYHVMLVFVRGLTLDHII